MILLVAASTPALVVLTSTNEIVSAYPITYIEGVGIGTKFSQVPYSPEYDWNVTGNATPALSTPPQLIDNAGLSITSLGENITAGGANCLIKIKLYYEVVDVE